MKKMNKKGFTLIELLAVIVVLAIVMVIATQKITDVINSSRSNAFISSYKMIVKQINTNMVTNTDKITCSETSATKCKDIYDISDDYDLSVKSEGENYVIRLKVPSIDGKLSGKFKNMDLARYGDASKPNANKTAYSCDTDKIGSGAEKCGKITDDVENGTKVAEYSGIKGKVAK